MMHISQAKMYLDGGCILTVSLFFFMGNNCITMSGGFRMACLEKCILEIALAAINDMEGENLSKRNE